MDMAYQQLDRLAADLGCISLVDEPLASRTTFKIGGPADRLITAGTQAQLMGLLQGIKKLGIPLLILGRGSDLLVGDRGFRGAALCLGGEFKKVTLLPDGLTVRAGAGTSLATVCTFARERSLTGLEFAWGIPGSAGGAVYMNAGAYGGEMKDVVSRVQHVDMTGVPGEFSAEALGFAYRRSSYTNSDKVITFAELKLEQGEQSEISGKMDELIQRRKEKQPYDMPSAGSTFKRPKTGYAAALIEQCGLKGRQVGGAQVSPKHAGFVVNTGGATCGDVLKLMEIIRETVLRETGIELEPEVQVTGEN